MGFHPELRTVCCKPLGWLSDSEKTCTEPGGTQATLSLELKIHIQQHESVPMFQNVLLLDCNLTMRGNMSQYHFLDIKKSRWFSVHNISQK